MWLNEGGLEILKFKYLKKDFYQKYYRNEIHLIPKHILTLKAYL